MTEYIFSRVEPVDAGLLFTEIQTDKDITPALDSLMVSAGGRADVTCTFAAPLTDSEEAILAVIIFNHGKGPLPTPIG